MAMNLSLSRLPTLATPIHTSLSSHLKYPDTVGVFSCLAQLFRIHQPPPCLHLAYPCLQGGFCYNIPKFFNN